MTACQATKVCFSLKVPCSLCDLSSLQPHRCEIIRGGMDTYLTPMGPTKLHVHPIFEIGPLQPTYSGEGHQACLLVSISWCHQLG